MENADKPAFIEVYDKKNNPSFGLTKREYAAIKAMQGIIAGNDYKQDLKAHQIKIAKGAIEIADELLKQLEQK